MFLPFYPQDLLFFSSWCHPLRWYHLRPRHGTAAVNRSIDVAATAFFYIALRLFTECWHYNSATVYRP